MPNSARVEVSSWWLTMSNAADRSRRMRSEERDESVTARRAVSVECPHRKPDW